MPSRSLLVALTSVLAISTLACGGAPGGESLASSEQRLSDTVAPLGTARSTASATKLADGRVMVTGGWNAGAALSTVEVFDPKTNVWSAAPSLLTPRADHTAITLKDGQVLVVGGYNGTAAIMGTPSVEVFDGTKWTAIAPSSMPRFWNAKAATLADGTVVILGWENIGLTDKTHVYTYAPTTKVWSTGRTGPTHSRGAFLQIGDDLLLAGGYGTTTWSVTADRYSATTNTWTSAGNLNLRRRDGQLVKVPGGAMLIGGRHAATSGAEPLPTTRVEFFNEVANTWTEMTPTTYAHTEGAVAVLPSGYVVAAGGGISQVELLDPKTDKWYVTTPLSKAAFSPTTALLNDGAVLVIGGMTDPTVTSALTTVSRYRQSGAGETCSITPECSVGTCTGGVCTLPSDAGPTDTGSTPPDSGAPSDTGSPSTDTGVVTDTGSSTDTGAPATDTGTTTDTGTPGDTGIVDEDAGDTGTVSTADSGEDDSGKVGSWQCPDGNNSEDLKKLTQAQYESCFGKALTFDAKACSTTPGATGGLGAWVLVLGIVAARRRRG